MTQSVLKTSVFLSPITRFGSPELRIALSDPVAFQNPRSVVPGIMAVDVEGADDVELELLAEDDAGEVEVEELLLRGVETEAREVLLHLHGRPSHSHCRRH
uniref:Uncharacterized protein n=1 Tax=Oryza meridionalis TaxID=40149 RepID=A0A0E0CUR3_9ORYZ